MVIVCSCEGLLENQPRGRDTTISCTNCHRSFPFKDAQQIMKLLRLAGREFDNDGKPANEHVRRAALNKAAYKIAALKLRVIDELEILARIPAPPPPMYYRQAAVYYGTATTTNSGFGNIYVTVVG